VRLRIKLAGKRPAFRRALAASGVVAGAALMATSGMATLTGSSHTQTSRTSSHNVKSAVVKPADTLKPTAASTGVSVFVGYADNLRANPSHFPSPWNGAPNVTFQGCQGTACVFDAGAVRVVNNTTQPVAVGNLAAEIGGCTFSLWAGGTLAPNAELIATQQIANPIGGCRTDGSFDTSDMGPNSANWSNNCKQSGVIPKFSMTLDGNAQTFTDTTQLLNTGGIDLAACNGVNTPAGAPNNESTQWTLIGTPVCTGAILDFQPPLNQTKSIGTQATVTATLTNSCGTPLQDVVVDFKVIQGPNAGNKDHGTTDSNGNVTFTYTSTQTGQDTISASVLVTALPPPNNSFPSDNTAAVVWVQPTVMTGRAFGLSADASVPLLKQNVNLPAFPDTGPIKTPDASDTGKKCTANLGGPINATAVCGQVVTSTTPNGSAAIAGVADVAVNLGSSLPVIRVKAVEAKSATTCSGSKGSATVASLAIGNTVITLPDTVPANDHVITNLLGVSLTLNEQITEPGGLTVNAVHLTIKISPAVTANVIIASATTDIHYC
jgi:hypothetical protein